MARFHLSLAEYTAVEEDLRKAVPAAKRTEGEQSPQGFAGQKNRQTLSSADNLCPLGNWSGRED